MQYSFEWDPEKAKANWRKHGISFEDGAGLFLDPLAITVTDDEHSETEGRWVTIGRDERGRLLVLVHTFRESSVSGRRIRIISARKAAKREVRQYEQTEL